LINARISAWGGTSRHDPGPWDKSQFHQPQNLIFGKVEVFKHAVFTAAEFRK